MAQTKTYMDELVEYPAKAIRLIGSDKNCVGLLINKPFYEVNDDDCDKALDDYIFSFQYIDNTTQEAVAYVWVEIDVPRVQNKTAKSVKLYVTVSCHKQYMKLDRKTFSGVIGNRRDNLVRNIDRLLNFSDIFGIGKLSLESIKTLSSPNDFTIRELAYSVPDFNLRDIKG